MTVRLAALALVTGSAALASGGPKQERKLPTPAAAPTTPIQRAVYRDNVPAGGGRPFAADGRQGGARADAGTGHGPSVRNRSAEPVEARPNPFHCLTPALAGRRAGTGAASGRGAVAVRGGGRA